MAHIIHKSLDTLNPIDQRTFRNLLAEDETVVFVTEYVSTVIWDKIFGQIVGGNMYQYLTNKRVGRLDTTRDGSILTHRSEHVYLLNIVSVPLGEVQYSTKYGTFTGHINPKTKADKDFVVHALNDAITRHA